MLETIYFAFSTLKLRNSGTKSNPVLILGDYQRDLLHHTFEVGEEGIKEGTSNLLEIDVMGRELQIYYSLLRLGIRGTDAWSPEFVFVFGKKKVDAGLSFQPIGLLYFPIETLSGDAKEGVISLPLKRADLGGYYNTLSRILILVKNSKAEYAGTKSPIRLEVYLRDGVLLNYTFPAGQLENSNDVFFTILKTERVFYATEITAIKLFIEGTDQWTPESMWVMALDDMPDEFEAVVPLVTLQDWKSSGLGKLSTDPNKGEPVKLLYQAFT
ncbi:MAG: hypothetical protein HC892_12880 [Saprospiraceae bacterium]|nr:hypothetical protein [Saprospiraceae bacterium]